MVAKGLPSLRINAGAKGVGMEAPPGASSFGCPPGNHGNSMDKECLFYKSDAPIQATSSSIQDQWRFHLDREP
jgi:hypothetical protein